jgi:hypothetical protein
MPIKFNARCYHLSLLFLLLLFFLEPIGFAYYEKPVTVLTARKLLIDELTPARSPGFIKVFTRPNCYFGKPELSCMWSVEEERKLLDKSVRVLALGDSWFAYPTSWLLFSSRHRNENIIMALDSAARARQIKVSDSPSLYILNYSNNGEHLSNMSDVMPPDLAAVARPKAPPPGVFHSKGISLNEAFLDQIRRANALDKPFHLILLSAGGNDFLTDGNFKANKSHIAGPFEPIRFSRILKESLVEAKSVHGERATNSDIEVIFKNKINQYMSTVMLQSQYPKLLGQIHDLSPSTKVIIQNYAPIVPRPAGFRLGGFFQTHVGHNGWAWKVMEANHIPLEYRKNYTDIMLNALGETLSKLESKMKPAEGDQWFFVLDTKTIMEQHRQLVEDFETKKGKANDYRIDEIHLSEAGYRIVAEALLDKIVQLFPQTATNLSK